MESTEKKQKTTVIGIVTSNKMTDTITVRRELRSMHPKFRKTIVTVSKFKAHDKGNTCGIGDTVQIQLTRPLSKTKRWKVLKIITKAK
jgi:small subunit ribosomal protein S17